jgi:translation elongation factor EF-4
MKKIEVKIIERGHSYRKGNLYLNGKLLMSTLEPADAFLIKSDPVDKINLEKKRGKCAIPYGTYTVNFVYSARFKRVVPILIDVPGFSGIEIHVGNSSADSMGCLLVGLDNKKGEDNLIFSKVALDLLMKYLNDGVEEVILITINS